MIAVRLQGRMGNQLFQYAFGYATAKKLQTSFYIDKNSQVFVLNTYFNITRGYWPLFDNSLYQFKLFRRHWYDRFYLSLRLFLSLKAITFDSYITPQSQLGLLENNAVYEGFFQSEKYFAGHENEVMHQFSIKRGFVNQFNSLRKTLHIPAQYIAVHIRRGDYINHQWDLSFNYFHNAIKSMGKDNSYYVFLSDEPGKIGNEFAHIQNKYLSNQPEIIDFQFLMNAAACIISNSSFSWWGAYLNPNRPRVIAPRYWLGFHAGKEFPVDIIPQRFEVIEAINEK